MLAIQIEDPGLKRQLIEHLIQCMEDGTDHALLRDAGLTHELVSTLRAIPVPELMQLAAMEGVTIEAGFAAASLCQALADLRRERAVVQSLDYFAAHGASVELTALAFSMPTARVRQLRRPGSYSAQPGRAKLPPARERQTIHEAWAALNKSAPKASLKDQLLKLHEQFASYSIQSLWCTLDEFGDETRARQAAVPSPIATVRRAA